MDCCSTLVTEQPDGANGKNGNGGAFRWARIRDIGSFVLGAFLLLFEASQAAPNPTILLIGAGLLGVPIISRQTKNGGKGD